MAEPNGHDTTISRAPLSWREIYKPDQGAAQSGIKKLLNAASEEVLKHRAEVLFVELLGPDGTQLVENLTELKKQQKNEAFPNGLGFDFDEPKPEGDSEKNKPYIAIGIKTGDLEYAIRLYQDVVEIHGLPGGVETIERPAAPAPSATPDAMPKFRLFDLFEALRNSFKIEALKKDVMPGDDPRQAWVNEVSGSVVGLAAWLHEQTAKLGKEAPAVKTEASAGEHPEP